MAPDCLRRYQAAMGLTIVLALSCLFFGRAQAIAPVRTSVAPADIVRRSVLVSSGTSTPKQVLYTGQNARFILTDVKVSLVGLPETSSNVAVTDRVYLQLRVGNDHFEDVDVTSFTYTGGARVTQSAVMSHHSQFQTGISIPNSTYVVAVVKRQASAAVRTYAVTIHGYYYHP